MAITRAQQVRQMLEDGGMLVQPGFGGVRQGYRGPGEYQSGKSDKKESGMSPGRSQAQFGHTGHAGKTEDQAKSDQRLGNDRPDSGPGSDPFAGHSQAEKKGFQKQQEISKQIEEGTFETPKKKGFIETFNEKKRKKNQEYLRNLRNKKFEGIAAAYGLSSAQMQKLLDAYSEDEDEFDLSTFRSIVDAGAPPSIIRSDPNFLKAQELALSKGMAKGNKLSTGALFSTEDPTTRIDLPGILGKIQGEENFSNVLSGLNRIQTLDKILDTPGGVKQSDIDNYFNLTMGKGGVDPVTGDTVDALFTPRDDDGPSQVTDPCKGPNPPAYCFIGGNAPTTPDPIFTPAFRFMNRGGMVEDAPVGTGIMDLESARQMMFIGGVAKAIGKGLKSATRAVKKVVKSPFGKAAILGAIGFGIPGTSFTGILGGKEASFSLGDILKKSLLKDSTGAFSLENLSGGKIAALSGLAGLVASKQTEEDNFDIDKYYEEEGLKNFIASLQPRYRLGTFNAAKGGKAEPVAKKTMPLLDLDGKEMDFRAEGGFVPIGRMEKADDVPARLSKNEFVFTADAVRNAGDGDVDKGAEVMYNTMKNLEAGGKVSEETQGLDGAKQMFQTAQRLEGVM
jgi:hypothetical protein